jgi:hypothetical protein
MTVQEAKQHIEEFLQEVTRHKDEDRAFVEGAQQYRHLLSLGCEPVTYFRAVFELIIERDPEIEAHIRQSELAKWIN